MKENLQRQVKASVMAALRRIVDLTRGSGLNCPEWTQYLKCIDCLNERS